jgi:hypothetical protein
MFIGLYRNVDFLSFQCVGLHLPLALDIKAFMSKIKFLQNYRQY